MRRVGLTVLMRVAFPGAIARWCDGGFFEFEGELYRNCDPVWGSVASVEPIAEGTGDELPSMGFTIFAPGSTPIADLDRDDLQGSRVKLWIAEFDAPSGEITRADLYYDGRIDRSVISIGRQLRSVDFEVGTMIERMLLRNRGNSLSSAWHKSVWPGETGHDNATGLKTQFAWGVGSPPAGVSAGGPYGGGGAARYQAMQVAQ
ncbi:hypothetical protein [uncultured Croceicoccus sp.]|uniref:hypothetical protein n=1 Tax=uncultured Croceicoccus sp. TaxID=1295329 RepID=UPI0026220793|nr:hypothetical protein [uncultured Croceicoccus sp.]